MAGIGGKDKLRTNLKGLIKDFNFSRVESLGIIRDADTDPSAAFLEILVGP